MDSGNLEKISLLSSSTLKDALSAMTYDQGEFFPPGIVLIADTSGKLEGIVTDGDIRRAILQGLSTSTPLKDIMTRDPITFSDDLSFERILSSITSRVEHVSEEKKRLRSGHLEQIILVNSSGQATSVMSFFDLWRKAHTKRNSVCVVGLGYVGLTLAAVLAEREFQVHGIDTNSEIVGLVNQQKSHFHEVGLNQLLTSVSSKLTAYIPDEYNADSRTYIVCVGTPVDSNHVPSMEYLLGSATWIGKRLRKHDLVILRSTVPVGTTRNKIIPVLDRESGLTAGTDYHIVFAPERTVEGNALDELYSLPQIIGGLTSECTKQAAGVFSQLTNSIVTVGSLEEAEMVKILNNCFRDVKFGFSNEIARICSKFNIDSFDVISAANNGYPRDKIPTPSPGVGGACLQKDPYILEYTCKQISDVPETVLAARKSNEHMPLHVAGLVKEHFASNDSTNKKIFMVGIAFKGEPETSDMRNSTSLNVLEQLGEYDVYCYDPVIPAEKLKAEGLKPATIEEGFKDASVVMFMNNHRDLHKLDVSELIKKSNRPLLVFDGWHFFSRRDLDNIEGVTYATLGYRS